MKNKKNSYNKIKKPPIPLNHDCIIENRWCHLCHGFHYVEKKNESKTTSYRCTNCDNMIWVEEERDYEMYPKVFLDDFENNKERVTDG